MSTQATGTLTFKSWEEKPYAEHEDGTKLANATVVNVFAGDIEGESQLQYLIPYLGSDDAVGTSIGLELVTGRLAGRTGSFVLRHDVGYAGDTAEGSWTVVPGSATGDLRGLRGEGGFVWKHGEPGRYTLDYHFEGQ